MVTVFCFIINIKTALNEIIGEEAFLPPSPYGEGGTPGVVDEVDYFRSYARSDLANFFKHLIRHFPLKGKPSGNGHILDVLGFMEY